MESLIKDKYSWNPVYCLVMHIKEAYLDKFHDSEPSFEKWLEKLENETYSDFFSCLQVNQDKSLLLIRYGLAEMQSGMWEDEDSLYRECRSLVIDIENNELVATPFRKFFNLNEVEENKIEKVLKEIEVAKSFEASNKLDCSMQFARYYNHDIKLFGSMALSKENSWRLEDGYKMLTNGHKRMIVSNQNLTFIFECINVKDGHVVIYTKEQEGLYLIGIRDTTTGYQYSYKEIKKFSLKYKVPMAEIEKIDLAQILEKCKTLKCSDKEGWVLNIDGHMLKIKCDDYCSLHKMLDKISSINVIIQNIAEDRFDDLLSKIPESYRDRVLKVAIKIQEWIVDTQAKIIYYHDEAPKDDTKTFMLWVEANCPKDISGYVKNKYNGKEYNVLKKGSGGYKKLKELGIVETYSALFSE